MSTPNTATGGPAPSYLDWLTADTRQSAADTVATDAPAAPDALVSAVSTQHGDTAGSSVTVVAGAHGGSGATITTLLLAMVAAADSPATGSTAVGPEGPVIALDGTAVGGDLTGRAPAQHCHPSWWQHWLIGGDDPAADTTALSDSGWTVLGRDRTLGETVSPLSGVITA
ncbi:hypothetical protein BJF84_26650 [Rhodococcus sp. CUA-806]|nr:hypothetical protein BJF84_26650 [Rhodococcus sp. CUA-806]